MYTHRLVAMLFVDGRTKQKDIVNHKDRNRYNNYYKNLEWTDLKGNSAHSMGKKVKQIDIKTNKVINIYNTLMGAIRSLCLLPSDVSSISRCCKGGRNTAYGYKWEYV